MAHQVGNATASRWQRWIGISLVVIIIGGVCFSAYFLLHRIFDALNGPQKDTNTAVLTASATVLATAFTAIGARWRERKNAIDQEQRQRRALVYEDYIGGILQLIGIGKPPAERTPPSAVESAAVYGNFAKKALIWGSDEVLTEYLRFSKASTSSGSGQQGIAGVLALGDLMLAIRKDLGYKNGKISSIDLMTVLIPDLENEIANIQLAQQNAASVQAQAAQVDPSSTTIS